MKRRVSDADGMAAIGQISAVFAGDSPHEPHAEAGGIARPVMMTAVRYALEELASLYPGRAVEVRVPPAGAVQILPGTTHRRGTPPAVIETDMVTFMALAVGALSWEDALASHRVHASGERTNLSEYFPIFS